MIINDTAAQQVYNLKLSYFLLRLHLYHLPFPTPSIRMSLYELRPIITTREVGWMLGMTLAAMGYVVLLTLSLSCIWHLRHTARASGIDRFWTQHHILRGYIVLVVAFNTILQVRQADEFIQAVFYTNPDRLTKFYWNISNVFVLLLAMLTDGLLVGIIYCILFVGYIYNTSRFGVVTWSRRRYLEVVLHGWLASVGLFRSFSGSAQQVSHSNQRIALAHLYILCVSLTALGIAAIATLDSDTSIIDKQARSFGETVLFFAILSNVGLNILATSNIVIRLLHYRNQISDTFGPGTLLYNLVNNQLRITNILLEAAALNIPVTLLGGIVLWRVEFFAVDILLQVAVPLQVWECLLVTHHKEDKADDVVS